MTDSNDVHIKITHSQIGMLVEVERDGDWRTVQLTKYRERDSSSVRQYSTCIDPLMDEREYLASLDRKGIKYTLAKQVEG